MSLLEGLAIFAGGIGAGTVNAIVGSGTLITFPILLAFGYAPVTANVSNTIGLVPGSLSAAHGYRRELRGRGALLARLAVASIAGGLAGAALLLALPASAFKTIVPVFIVLALVLVITGPRLTAALASRPRHVANHPFALPVALFLCGVYGGYFGAAQGVLLLAVLGVTLSGSLQEINGIKNVLAMFVNLVAGLVFVIFAHVAWWPVALIAAGSIIGGQVGAKVGRRLPDSALRGAIVVVGLLAIAKLLA